jgi:zinc transport system permease protein
VIRFFADMAVNELLLRGLLAGVLAGVACGLIGPYVVTRRIVFLSGAIAHIVVGGIGAVIFLRFRLPGAFGSIDPLYGAVLSALVAAALVGCVQHFARERLDTLIGALWAIGMAVGILLLKYTPGYQTEIFSYLFGNVSVVSREDLILLLGLDAVIVAALLLTHKRLKALCLDEEFAGLQGISVLCTNLLLLGLVSLAVVALIRVVGLILVIALLSLPAATSRFFAGRLSGMMAVSVALCVLLTTLPRAAVYGTRVSPESAIVLASALAYVLALLTQRLLRGARHS